ncbi:MAG: thiol-disulfide isomerase-like thioredoxin [Phycisphaerales bacterium]|nr:thiol-disulfide isomerase-like thioredoxin [Phycisphaerales bacterium]
MNRPAHRRPAPATNPWPLVTLAMAFALASSARGQATEPAPAARLAAARAAIRETEDASEVARKRPQASRDQAEVDRTHAAFVAALQAGRKIARDIFKTEPSTDAGLDACDLILTGQFQSLEATDAMQAVARFHAGNPRIGPLVARSAYYNPCPGLGSYDAVGVLLDAVEKKNTDRVVLGQAALGRARRALTVHQVADNVAMLVAADGPAEYKRSVIALSQSQTHSTLDVERTSAEAIAAFDQVIKLYGDVPDLHRIVPLPTPESLADDALPQRYELQHLRIGLPAPEIEGVDLNGRPFKLSDFRGKAVLLFYWASWCGPCMAAVPHERELAERFAGRPFALVGVNADEDRDHGLAVATKERVAGRSFWNGPDGSDGPIAKAWNVRSWPTNFLIDAAGTIRFKGLGEKDLDAAIEKLVAEAKQSPGAVHQAQ